MIQALLFDAAGTLFEPAEAVAETYSRLLSPHVGPLDPAELRGSFGDAFKKAGDPEYPDFQDGDTAERHWWRGVVESTVGQTISDEAFDELFEYYAHASAWRIFPEVRSTLAQASEIGLRCSVVSNFDLRLHRILADLDLTFEQVVTSADACARKPSPAIFQQALEALDLTRHQVLHVGDTRQADLIGAQAAGIDAFLVERPTSDLGDFLRWARNHPEFR
ncbi:HAD-IA family hydrolase [Haloferula sp.]|uniref:HAD-IA family hydrolase n=1 Tax=Haloferula sp. TaxID=2497595 RepID=UPI00329C793D